MSKQKVLIICYYWPPAGGPGVQRWLKFVKYLPDFDIEPIVYCPKNPNYPITDQSLVNEIPDDITVLKHPISEPYRYAKLFSKKNTKTISSGVIPEKKKQSLVEKLMLYIRGNFFIPDARKNWLKPSVNFLSNYIKENNINTIITTGPPHSLHLIGLQLKKQLGVNWLTDFRDPWTTIGYHKDLKLTTVSQKKHIELERSVLNTSDQIIVTSHHTKNEFETKTKQPIAVITNGYDSHSVVLKNKDAKFSLSHIGSLLSERNPKVLWEVLSELIKENKDFANDFELKLIGIVSEKVIASIEAYNLDDYINVLGYVSHNEAIHAQMASQILLLIEIDSETTKAIIPGKLFEYMQSKTPILALGPNDSDVEQIIKTTNTGTYFNYNSKAALKNQILSYYKMYKKESLKACPIGIEKYSRKQITKQLSELILANN
ncbi:glycosyltransferase family 4 protein [Winogradskyella immobilis]|uniref:Glycosyltransferase family 4 protein n=1 Tax=Winogradskyella immobilis TaxID=2816852 RepID=A0ABS8EP07_9FLAO|nr:glycosyltransferase family 4 protein [Winogradskyella immobilis]MCC1484597.1 glycosyltransferase family 4 protein [Winogradskyella immobilis]MCG0016689.1 glycosyltransferase family 4 protein [Winogradskyella immobilis]